MYELYFYDTETNRPERYTERFFFRRINGESEAKILTDLLNGTICDGCSIRFAYMSTVEKKKLEAIEKKNHPIKHYVAVAFEEGRFSYDHPFINLMIRGAFDSIKKAEKSTEVLKELFPKSQTMVISNTQLEGWGKLNRWSMMPPSLVDYQNTVIIKNFVYPIPKGIWVPLTD